ncbi:MAG: hypothetical protein R3Y35_04245 [Clostridia bacterium]
MKKLTVYKVKTYLFIIVAILLLSITFVSIFLEKDNKTDEIIENNYTLTTAISQDESSISDEKFTIYTVKELDGVMTVFKDGEKLDIMLNTVLVNTLPVEDREIIENGVEFTNYTELISFLEDYE